MTRKPGEYSILLQLIAQKIRSHMYLGQET